jgi:hypothetical protein
LGVEGNHAGLRHLDFIINLTAAFALADHCVVGMAESDTGAPSFR